MTSTRPVLDTVFAAVLFDMDGTLISSTPAVRRSWARWGRELGLPENFREGGGHGMPARSIVASFVPAEQVDEAFARIEAIEIEEVDGVDMLAGAAEALAAIGEPRKAVVTSCTAPLFEARMAAAGLVRPATVVTASDVTNGKPDPEPFLLGASLLGVDPAHCLVVEDAFAGLVAGRASGAATLGVAGTHDASELDADLVVSGLDAVRFEEVDGGVRVTLR
ncbi:HAD-IA family hydrolase [Frondihabitans australicus]|uniref:Sugar-phosphatase n=1 Tax=Frondihabitans australicus TaxID=386892 RepID=A0A495IGR1_9MICO|nr:HAD-IA family hydrolase [Frondihabitans australicus]RKR75192.1 sugar-phosphatase [Frondihabitans australicus]